MKQAFKSVLTIDFTQNRSKLDYETVRSYFQSSPLPNGIDFEDLVTPFKGLIESLISRNLRDEESLKAFLEEYRFLDAQSINDIITVWNQEKAEVFSFLTKKSLPGQSLEHLDWAINMQTYSRRAKNLKEISFLFSLKLRDRDAEKPKYVNFEVNKQELGLLYGQFQEIENSIGELFARKK